MTVERAVHRLTGELADGYQLDAGHLRKGDWADLVLVDPERLDASLIPGKLNYPRLAVRSRRCPRRQTVWIDNDSAMVVVGSPSMSTMSACNPGCSRPRSARPNQAEPEEKRHRDEYLGFWGPTRKPDRASQSVTAVRQFNWQPRNANQNWHRHKVVGEDTQVTASDNNRQESDNNHDEERLQARKRRLSLSADRCQNQGIG